MSILGTQQNAVGFSGYDTIAGPNNRSCKGYGENKNKIINGKNMNQFKDDRKWREYAIIRLPMQCQLRFLMGKCNSSLHNDFTDDGKLAGEKNASSPKEGVTVDGALAKDFSLKPGEEKTITFVFSWYFPKGTFGRADMA